MMYCRTTLCSIPLYDNRKISRLRSRYYLFMISGSYQDIEECDLMLSDVHARHGRLFFLFYWLLVFKYYFPGKIRYVLLYVRAAIMHEGRYAH